MRQQSIITLLLIVLFAGAAINMLKTATLDTQNQDKTTTVVEVIDGDTVDVLKNGEEDTARVLGIDTPEVKGQNTPSEFYLKNTSENRQCLRKMGEEASNFAKEKLNDKQVDLVQDSQSDKRGYYGRLLAYVEYNQTELGKELLEKGYARVYNSSFSRKEKYRGLETESRERGRGIWSENCG